MKKIVRIIIYLLGVVIIPFAINILTNRFGLEKISSEHLIVGVGIFILIAIIFELILVNSDSPKPIQLKNNDTDIISKILHKKNSISVIPEYLSRTKFINSRVYRFNIKAKNNKYNFLVENPGVSLKDLQDTLIKEIDCVTIISGRGGYGKSTLLRQLTKNIAGEIINSTESNCLPFFIPLGDYNSIEIADISLYFINSLGLNQIEDKYKLKIVLLLDGFNEINVEKFELILKTFVTYCRSNSVAFSIVISTRPLSVKLLQGIVPSQIVTKYFHIENWTANQVSEYLKSSGVATTDLKKISNNTLNILKTPYIASLFIIGSINKEDTDVNYKLTDIILNYINNYLSVDFDNQVLVKPPVSFLNLNSQSRLEVLSEIAFRLNQNSSLIFTDKLIGIVLDEESSSAMASSLENYGIITSSKLKNETNKYKFTHQIIQEFLSAYYIWLKGDVKLLPQRPSENVFWFDIPLYLSELDPRNSLNTLQYLNDKGDFFSIARILKSSDIESNSKIDIEYVTHKIVDSLKGFDSYSRAPETIIELGGKAESILINEVKMVNKKLLASEEIWASKNISVEDEIMYDQNWRVVGRSIHLLSLYNSRLLLNVFEQRIDEIMSVHLVYHILEYILRNLSSWKIKDKFRATRLLSRIKVNDPIISYYKFHIKHVAIGLGFGKINKAREEKLWDDVYDFIMSVTYTTNRKFFANFWIRNHGIECLTDFMPKGKSKVFFEGISKIFELENEFHYPTTKPFYVAIFKSSLIGLKKLKAQSINVEVGIEQLVKSPRLFESSWARKYIYDYIDNADQTDFAHLSKMVSLVNDDQVKSRISLKLNQLN